MREIAIENALFAFIVKALLIFLSIVGYCNLWFAIFIDFVAAVATILNTIRVTSESLITTLKYKAENNKNCWSKLASSFYRNNYVDSPGQIG